MNLGSVDFLLLFLPLFLIGYWKVPVQNRNQFLFLGSIAFYALGVWNHLLPLLLSVFANYLFGIFLGKGNRRMARGVLTLGIFFNLILLSVCKMGNLTEGMPIGVSFYTFQALSYLIDCYQGREEVETNFWNFAAYLSMFPKLLSGPIVSYGAIRRQMGNRQFSTELLAEGMKLFTAGLALKVFLADRIGLLWREIQVTGFESISTQLSWIGAIAFSFQLYFDFYGYSLMAMGLGKMIGINLPKNFKVPYLSGSVREFYRRWHVTLGKWFTNYIYIPLGGNRKGEARTLINIMLVWLLTSLWHGFGANYLLWGMSLCTLILFERILRNTNFFRWMTAEEGRKRSGRILAQIYVWFVIPITWMCFAITDVYELQGYLGKMFGFAGNVGASRRDWLTALHNYKFIFMGCILFSSALPEKLFRLGKNTWIGNVFFAVVFWLCIWRLQLEGQNPFYYFSF